MKNSKKTKEDLEQLFEEALNTLKRTKKLEGSSKLDTSSLMSYIHKYRFSIHVFSR